MKPRMYAPLAAAVALACGATLADDERDEQTRAGDVSSVEDPRVGDRHDGVHTEAAADVDVDVEDAGDLGERRAELTQMADETIRQLRSENPEAAGALEDAHGYAVFDTTKGGLIVTGAGGTGVAQEQPSGEETYMHLGAAGVGLGAGLENYKLVLVFEDGATYEQFVSGDWDGSLSAQAAAGDEGAAAEETAADGVDAFRITDAGLIAQIDVTGMRFWPSDRLNGAEHEG